MTKLRLFNSKDIRSAVQPLADQLPSSKRGEEKSVQIPTSVKEYDDAIRDLWVNAQQKFLEIGGYIARAQRTLTPDDFGELCDRLPFGKSARSQLMAAYRLVESKSLPDGCERAGYATVYLCATLTEDERISAIEAGVIVPEMTRAGIVEFKRSLRPPAAPTDRKTVIKAELAKLAARMSMLQEELDGFEVV